MGFMLSGNWGLEFTRDYISAVTKDEELIQSLFSYSDAYFDELTEVIITEEELKDIGLYTTKRPEEIRDIKKGNLTQYIEEIVHEIIEDIETVSLDGSNAWVVSGEHTETGKPIIANDPHLGNGIPSIWFYSHTEYPDGSFVSGATLPGIPFYTIFTTEKIGKFNRLLLFYNLKIAFTVTATIADVLDIYEEKIIGDFYEFEGELYPLKIREEIIKVKKKDDIHLIVKSTMHGPIVS